MPTKIVLTGSFSVGKTSLLGLFKDQGYIVPEIARPLLEANPSMQSDPEFQNIVLKAQLEEERRAEVSGAPLIICDRGTIDVVAFSRFYGYPEPAVFNHYDEIFLCSPKGVPCVYGEQAMNMRMDLHKIFLEVLAEQKNPYFLLEGSVSSRLSQIESVLLKRGIEGNFNSWQERK